MLGAALDKKLCWERR